MSQITYLGHSAFLLRDQSHRLIIDPYLSGNPLAAEKPENIKVDYVLLTHGHGDHLGDGIMIANDNDATVIAPYELAVYCGNQGCKVHPMHLGGSFNFPFGRVKLTIAFHGSGSDLGGESLGYMGNPCGFLVTLGGKIIYHAGDTALFLDMQLIGEMNKIDVAMLPIGDNFTMGIDDALKAAEFLKPKLVVPMHYRTFDVINVEPLEFKNKAAAKNVNVKILEIGETLEA